MDRLFRMPAPVRYRVKDGSGKILIVEHRLGRAAGAFQNGQLMKRTGLEKEYTDLLKKLQRKVTNTKEFEDLSQSLWGTQKKKLGHMVRGYRDFLIKFYAVQGVLPCMTYVPLDEHSNGLYIQALVDVDSFTLMAGEPEDAALWNEVTAIREKSHVNLYNRAIQCAKQLMKLPSVNKDLQHRMKLLTTGEIPSSVKGLLGGPSR